MNQKNEVTLFLIEDDDVDAMTINRAFKKQRIGNPIVRAHDGIEALKMLESGMVEAPYIILLDIQMPRMNGVEFLQAIRDNKNFHDSVIFVLTSSEADEDIVASYEKHIAGYFVKDKTGKEFLDIVNLLEGFWRVVHLPEKTS